MGSNAKAKLLWSGRNHPKLSVQTQCHFLAVSRSSLDRKPAPGDLYEIQSMRTVEQTCGPGLGIRRIAMVLERGRGLALWTCYG
jgi:hypothetical protein